MSSYREEQESVVVATAATASEAALIQMRLAAQGISASVSASDPAHPSLDFVQGVRVFVRAEEEAAARELLAPPQPPDPPHPPDPSQPPPPGAPEG